MMTTEGPLQLISTWGLPLIFIAGNFIILVACIVGATHPVLRKEFVFLALGSLVHCFGSITMLVLNIVVRGSSDSRFEMMKVISYVSGALSLFGLLFYMVGFILLALRVRSLPFVRR